MAHVRIVRSIRIGNVLRAVKKVPQLAPIIVGSTLEATAVQLRVMAQEARELIVDRAFAADPTPPGLRWEQRPPRLVAQDLPGAKRDPLSYPPLSRAHVMKKLREGADGRFFIERGDYLAGIEVFKGEQNDSGVYYMVRMSDREHQGANPQKKPIRLTLLAKVLERGSAKHNIPPRPHWGPALKDIIQAFKDARPAIRAEALRLILRRIP